MPPSKAARYSAILQPWPVRLAATKAKGRHVKAERDLPTGSTVLIERAAAFTLLKPVQDELCAACTGALPCSDDARGDASAFRIAVKKRSVVCCEGCRRQTYYCSDCCRDDDRRRHALECDVLKQLPGITAMSSVDYNLFKLVLVILTMQALEREDSDAEDDAGNSENEDDAGDSENDEVVAFEQQRRPTPTAFVDDLLSHRSYVDATWLKAVEVGANNLVAILPPTLKTTPAAIVKLACQINANSHVIIDPSGNTNNHIAMLNHSCAPNACYVADHRGVMLVRTLAPIARGEELTLSYVDLLLPKQSRRDKLLISKFFHCACARCEFPEASTPTVVDPDLYLEGVLCSRCADGNSIHIPPTAAADGDDAPALCQRCSHPLPLSTLTFINHAALRAFDAAYDFARARQPESCLVALLAFRSRHSAVLHARHHAMVDAASTALACARRLVKIDEAVALNEAVVGAMRACCPANWPELADFVYSLGEVREIRARAVQMGVTVEGGEDELKGKKEGEDWAGLLRGAMAAYEECREMRRVACGEGHQRFVDVDRQVRRLRVDLEEMET
ncbi:hypothetical protein HK101_004276 [Irineochytrium annulatum]|nr:hypothetical protein HK101_004276 [Irineochytrium annulatum]